MKQKIMLMIALIMVFDVISYVAFVKAADYSGEVVIVSLLNQNPDPATTGNIVEIRLGIQNIGDTSTPDEVVEILPQYPFKAISGENLVQDVGVISTNQAGDNTRVVKFKVKVEDNTNAGSFNLPVLVYEKGKKNLNEKRLFSIAVEGRESAEIIYIDQVELLPGQITPMKFTISNVGSSPLRDLTFKWDNDDGIILPVGSDNTKYIKYIDIGDSAELTYNVIASANANPDLYKLNLKLTYEDPINGSTKVIQTTAGIYIGGQTDFDVTFSGSSSGQTSFSISNIGSVQAGSVTIRIPMQEGWRVTGSNSVIIGNLNKGDYTIASFNLEQASATPNLTVAQRQNFRNGNFTRAQVTSTVKLEIVYTDTRGNRNTITKEVTVTPTTTSGQSAQGNGRFTRQNPIQEILNTIKWIGISAVVLLVFLFVRRRYKKGKLKDPDYTYVDALKDILPGKRKK